MIDCMLRDGIMVTSGPDCETCVAWIHDSELIDHETECLFDALSPLEIMSLEKFIMEGL
jgi:hypothetical protein